MPTKTTTAKTTTILTAGQKAAATRRANQLKAKRSATAHKAWATRRANAATSASTGR